MNIPIEDLAEDVIGKAQSGQGISNTELSETSGLPTAKIAKLKRGQFDAEAGRTVAPHLGLNADALVALGENAWYPDPIELEGLICANTPYPVPGYEEMSVNAYLIADPASGQAVAFDTGARAAPLLVTLQSKEWTLQNIFLTHTHGDHIADLPSLKAALPPEGKVYAHPAESQSGAAELREGQTFQLGALEITAWQTAGHSPGGMSFVIQGLERPVAIVGDALFAGSIGGVRANYRLALKQIRERILSLPPETILCPGHGPLTTVANERARNPFFANDFKIAKS